MACISPDGKPTESGIKMMRALQLGMGSPEKIAQEVGVPLFKARSSLRELNRAGLAIEKDDTYELSPKGIELLDTISS